MARNPVIHISLTPEEVRLAKSYARRDGYDSVSAVVRESLRKFLATSGSTTGTADAALAKAYKATAKRDRAMASEWWDLDDAWPEK